MTRDLVARHRTVSTSNPPRLEGHGLVRADFEGDGPAEIRRPRTIATSRPRDRKETAQARFDRLAPAPRESPDRRTGPDPDG